MDETLISVTNLKTYFYTEEGVVRAVDGVDFSINKGEVLGLVGESGCGKSTIGLSLLRLVPNPGRIVEGEMLLEGENIMDFDEDKMRQTRGGKISIIWQDPMSSLNPVFSIGNQIAEAIELHQDLEEDKIMEKVIDMLDKVNIPDSVKRTGDYPHEFSGGMRQRVMIAMALSCNSQLLIADEPTTSLDVTIQAQILELMKELQKEFHSSILLITHNLGVVAEMADKVAVMYAGKIVEYADTMSVFKKPLHPYTQALLESIPRIDIHQETLKSIPGMVPDLIETPEGCRFSPRCEFAMDVCSREEPPYLEIEPQHFASCHLLKKGEN